MITILLAALLVVDGDSAALLGSWTNESGSVVVLIASCGKSEALCGTVQSASEKAKSDAKRGGTPELIGTELLHDFVPSGPGRWKGMLFVPDLHKRSKAEIEQLDDARLRVRGCALGRVLCRSQVWSRVPGPPTE